MRTCSWIAAAAAAAALTGCVSYPVYQPAPVARLSPEQSAAVIDKVPGGREAAAAAAEDEAEGGGTAAPGLMGLANRLMSEGVGMGDMQALGRVMFGYLRGKAGDDAVGELAGAIPGLGQYM